MTVKELIEKLREFPEDAPVIAAYDGEWYETYEVNTVEVKSWGQGAYTDAYAGATNVVTAVCIG